MVTTRLRRTSRRADARVALSIARAAFDKDRALIANLIITRRCNLSCGAEPLLLASGPLVQLRVNRAA